MSFPGAFAVSRNNAIRAKKKNFREGKKRKSARKSSSSSSCGGGRGKSAAIAKSENERKARNDRRA